MKNFLSLAEKEQDQIRFYVRSILSEKNINNNFNPEELPKLNRGCCTECRKEIQPQYTDRYRKIWKEYKLKGGIRPNTELQCPLCNTILPFVPIHFIPVRGPIPGYKMIWERTTGWFRKFLP